MALKDVTIMDDDESKQRIWNQYIILMVAVAGDVSNIANAQASKHFLFWVAKEEVME